MLLLVVLVALASAFGHILCGSGAELQLSGKELPI